jgi:hypothetical protein
MKHIHHKGQGLFADLNELLKIYYDACEKTTDFEVDITYEFYAYKDKLSDISFDPFIIFNKPTPKYIEHFKNVHHPKLNNPYHKTRVCTCEHRKKLIDYGFQINPELLNRVNNFYNNNKDYYLIGVHSRFHYHKQSAVSGQTQLVNPNQLVKNIDKYIEENNIKNYKIYLSTDLKYTLNIFIEKYGNNLLYNKENIWMSDKHDSPDEPHFGWTPNLEEKREIFHKNKPGYKGGQELLIDALSLSKCNYFFPSNSNLSQWVINFNPDIKLSIDYDILFTE